MFFTSIHLVYVRIPGKEITVIFNILNSQILLESYDEDHLPAVEALLVLTRAPLLLHHAMVPLAITRLSCKFFSFKDTFYINHINNRYFFLSIIHFFIFYVLFSH
jgi:hypothetical protein